MIRLWSFRWDDEETYFPCQVEKNGKHNDKEEVEEEQVVVGQELRDEVNGYKELTYGSPVILGETAHRYGYVQNVVSESTHDVFYPYLGHIAESHKELVRYNDQRIVSFAQSRGSTESDIIGTSFSCFLTNLLPQEEEEEELSYKALFRKSASVNKYAVEHGLKCVARSLCLALAYLHENGLCHGLLSAGDVVAQVNSEGVLENIRILGYCIPYILQHTPLKIEYMCIAAPESVLLFPPRGSQSKLECFYPRADVWAMGMILAQVAGLYPFEEDPSSAVEQQKLLEGVRGSRMDLFECDDLDPDFCDFVSRCLYINPASRDSAKDLLGHAFLRDVKSSRTSVCEGGEEIDLYFQLRSGSNLLQQNYGPVRAPGLLDNVDVAIARLSKHAYKSNVAAVTAKEAKHAPVAGDSTDRMLPTGGGAFGGASELLASMIRGRPIERGVSSKAASSRSPSPSARSVMSTREKSFSEIVLELQERMHLANLHRGNEELRMAVADSVLTLSKDHACQELSTSLRGRIWAVLLGIPVKPDKRKSMRDAFCGSPMKVNEAIVAKYDMVVDRLLWPHEIDRQLEQDVPRCHQYHVLLAGQECRNRLAYLLKAWVLLNPRFQYWQGLDSVGAAVLTLYPGNPVMAFAVLDELIACFLPNMFSEYANKKSNILQDRLHMFDKVLCFHDPVLALHFGELQVKSNQYAVSWMLAMFAHVLPIPLLYRVWDRLLAQPIRERGAGILVFATCVMVQLRNVLLKLDDFGDCATFLTRLPVSLDYVIGRALRLYDSARELTPRFRGLTWAEPEYPAVTSCSCLILPVDELLERWASVFVIHIVEAEKESGDDFKTIQGAWIGCDRDAAMKQIISRPQSKRIVALYGGNVDSFYKFIVDSHKVPFVCALEPDVLETLARLSPGHIM